MGRAPGRGVYVSAERAALEEALSPKGLGRAFKGAAKAPAAAEVERILEETAGRLAERLLDLVGLARRAGVLVLGMDPVLQALRDAPGGTILILAEDMSERSAGRVEEALERLDEGHRPRRVRVGTKTSLGSRLGRDEVGVVAIRPSTLAERVAAEADRHEGFSLPGTTGPVPDGGGGPRGSRGSPPARAREDLEATESDRARAQQARREV